MTARSLYSIVAVTLALLSCGCTQRTPSQRDAATKEVLQAVLGPSVGYSDKPSDAANKASDATKPASESINIEPSIVKNEQKTSESKASPSEANSVLESDATTEDAKQKSEPKFVPKLVVDDPSKPWTTGITFPRETWEVQYYGYNNPVGYFYHRIELMEGGSLRHKAEGKLRVSIKGESMEQYVLVNTTERTNGELVTLDGRLEIGEKKQTFNCKINSDSLTISGLENGQPFSTTISWDKRFRGPFAVEQSMFRTPLQPLEVRKLKYFDPLLRKLIDGRLEADRYSSIPTLLGGNKDLLEVSNIGVVGEGGSMAKLWVDNRGEGFKSYVPENDILSCRAPASDAEVVASIAELRKQDVFSVPLTGDIERLFDPRLKSITFKVKHDEISSPNKFLKEGSAHRLRSKEASEVDVTVYRGGLEPDAYQDSDETTKVDANALVPSSFIPSNYPNIINLANAMVNNDKSISLATATNFQKANACRREIQKRIGVKPFDKKIGLFTDIGRKRNANCIEHALLLAANCRALKIPTRIVLGLKFNQVKESPSMVFHAWIEIQDGKKWIPMDATDVPSVGEAIEEGTATIDRIRIKVADFNCTNPYLEILSVSKLLPGMQIKVLPKEVP